MRILPVSTFNVTTKQGLNDTTKSTALNSNVYMKDTVSFGNAQEDTMQKMLKVVKEIFTMLDDNWSEDLYKSPIKRVQTEFDVFEGEVSSIAKKLSGFFPIASEFRLTKNAQQVGEIGDTKILAYEREIAGERFFMFQQYDKKNEFLKSLTLSEFNNAKINVNPPKKNPLVKKAYFEFNPSNPDFDYQAIRVTAFGDINQTEKLASKTTPNADSLFDE